MTTSTANTTTEKIRVGAKRADAKGRVTLGPEAVGKEFDVVRNSEGQFILTPMVRVPEREAWLYKNRQALALFQAGLADAAAGRVTDAEDFSQYTDTNPNDNTNRDKT